MAIDFVDVTEVAGDSVSREQVQRMVTRYRFAADLCGKGDALEVACGSGQGLGLLAQACRKTVGGDYSPALLGRARVHYGKRVPLVRFDAHRIPFRDGCFDAVVLYEAIYYLRSPEAFVAEAGRVLRPGGRIILCTANKDLPDFNPSPHSHRYFSPPELAGLLRPAGFSVQCFADCPVGRGPKQWLLSFAKRTIVRSDLMPKTMAGKKLFKRLAFGRLVPLPHEITDGAGTDVAPVPIDCTRPDRTHKVLFAVGRLPS